MKELFKLVLATGLGVFLVAAALAVLFPDSFRAQAGRTDTTSAASQQHDPRCAPHPVKFPCLQQDTRS
jgi:hypothetical protein